MMRELIRKNRVSIVTDTQDFKMVRYLQNILECWGDYYPDFWTTQVKIDDDEVQYKKPFYQLGYFVSLADDELKHVLYELHLNHWQTTKHRLTNEQKALVITPAKITFDYRINYAIKRAFKHFSKRNGLPVVKLKIEESNDHPTTLKLKYDQQMVCRLSIVDSSTILISPVFKPTWRKLAAALQTELMLELEPKNIAFSIRRSDLSLY